ncbi:UDP-N-acetylmuramoyl-tripeptide--D-alanyl-D-alanine ligase [Nocardioides currus]|uniref:UDP-N-acetylmuramoyl-tripeptide--D-alanyl-D-alanine ligase n=1 Tax=Nocardioides currus TaxID=2133958 RepID=A0A2R7YW10_9ACTN|nr:UDP-N-acetylmuramoyl-tripeptide--D-alanyl-D-alanine ligase [Nocardioides currus]PUA80558.1 UDP-N-acetylmuramoyl-tripeptide--D-alanyl-D-alanine ligase [Nocardioides currus]
MIAMTLAEIAEVVGGTVHGDPASESTVVTGGAFVDTRTPEADGLFVAIAGERVDGHDLAEQAIAAGAVAVLGSRPTTAPTVVVDDVVAALGALARHVHDSLTDLATYALTGSQGKTGTKDYLAAILEGDGPIVATRGNFNNEIGVPLTVLRAGADTKHLVVEMGARGIGHIAQLCRIAPPDVAAVVNVGTAHIGEFGSREAIAVAKGEIVEALTAEGTAVLNADDALVAAMAPRTTASVVTFGAGGDLRATEVSTDELGRPSFDLQWRGSGATVHLGQLGLHQVENALAAAAMALSGGLDLDAVADGLTDARPPSRWRMEVHERADGTVVVNDAYNANPESMAAALAVLDGIRERSGRRTIAVLGEMFELGEGAVEAHRAVGRTAARAGVDVLLTIGDMASRMAEAARAEAGWSGEAIVTAGHAEAVAWLRQNGSAGDVVLVKASRGAALERVAEAVLDEPMTDEPSDDTPAEGSRTP